MIKIFKEITNVLGYHFNKITLIDTSVKINRTEYCQTLIMNEIANVKFISMSRFVYNVIKVYLDKPLRVSMYHVYGTTPMPMTTSAVIICRLPDLSNT